MPKIDNGFPWQGQQYTEQLSPRITRGLGGAILRANVEAVTHPGLYFARYDDARSPQELIRPAIQIAPNAREQWAVILGTNIAGGAGDGR